jgi:2-keto-4-pentenoate hydratase/2-oxohepta-3-ene-1,7-dioic acid hydratase in catechol pathway
MENAYVKFCLASFESPEGPRVGLVSGDRIMEINDILSLPSPRAPFSSKGIPRVTSMMDLLEAWDDFFPILSSAARFWITHPGAITGAVPLKSVPLLTPVLNPGKIINTGLNSYDHAQEMGVTIPSQGFQPNFFFKGDRCCLIGPGQRIRISSRFVDWEAELAVVIGRKTKDVTPADAMGHIAGYTCHNDITDRHLLVKKDGSIDFFRGKSRDTFGPFGPFLVPRQFVPNPLGLRIRCSVNDEIMQDSSTSQYYWGPEECVSYLSTCMTLMPGDLIALGTVAGTGWAYGIEGPRDLGNVIEHMNRGGGRFLRHQDRVRVEISEIGGLENIVEGE